MKTYHILRLIGYWKQYYTKGRLRLNPYEKNQKKHTEEFMKKLFII